MFFMQRYTSIKYKTIENRPYKLNRLLYIINCGILIKYLDQHEDSCYNEVKGKKDLRREYYHYLINEYFNPSNSYPI